VTEKHTVVFALRPPVPTGPTIDILIDPPIVIDAALKRAETKRAQDDADIEQLNKLIRRRK
jgi:hypothetical protein